MCIRDSYWRGVNAKKLLLLRGAGAGLNLVMSAALTVISFPEDVYKRQE